MANVPKQAVLLLNVEPEIDTADGAKAVAALKQAKSVMAFTPFVSETLLDVCDVLLPIAPFTETSGSFINMEGRLQSFHGVVQGFGDSRPLWKVLRVLGNLFDLKGFEYHDTAAILKDALDVESLPSKLNNRAASTQKDFQTPQTASCAWAESASITPMPSCAVPRRCRRPAMPPCLPRV